MSSALGAGPVPRCRGHIATAAPWAPCRGRTCPAPWARDVSYASAVGHHHARDHRARDRRLLAIALAGTAVSLAATLVLSRAGRESLNVRGAFLHLATDLAAFAGTALAGGLILLTGWNRFDPIAGLAVAALMFWSSASLLRDSGRI